MWILEPTSVLPRAQPRMNYRYRGTGHLCQSAGLALDLAVSPRPIFEV